MKPERTKTVLIFRKDLLPVSETFVLGQASELTSFRAQFVGLMRSKPSLDLPPGTIVGIDDARFPEGIQKRLYTLLGASPLIHRRRFIERIVSEAPAIIHAHFAPDGAAALPLSEHLHLPLLVTLHGYDVTVCTSALSKTTRGRTFLSNRKKLWETASVFLCVSEFIRKKAIAAGYPIDKLVVHYNGVELTDTAGVEDAQIRARLGPKKVVLFIGRLVEKKGCEYFLRAMAAVQTSEPGAHAVIIGGGPLLEELKVLSVALGVQADFLGGQPSREVRKWLRSAEVLCCPSVTASNGDSEGLPMVILEAHALGIPVAGTYHAGIPEAVIHEETGLLSEERDEQMLAQHIIRFIEDRTFRSRCGDNAVELVRQRFTISAQSRKLEGHYREILNQQ